MSTKLIDEIADRLYRWQSYNNRIDAFKHLCEDEPSVAESFRAHAQQLLRIAEAHGWKPPS